MTSAKRSSTFTGTNGTLLTTASTAALVDETNTARAWTAYGFNAATGASSGTTTTAGTATYDIQSNRGRTRLVQPATAVNGVARRLMATPGTFIPAAVRFDVSFYLNSFGDVDYGERFGVILRQDASSLTNCEFFGIEFGGVGVGKGTRSAASFVYYVQGAGLYETRTWAPFDFSALPSSTDRNNYRIQIWDTSVLGYGRSICQLLYWVGTGGPGCDFAPIDPYYLNPTQPNSYNGEYYDKVGSTARATFVGSMGGYGYAGRVGLYVIPGYQNNDVIDIRWDDFSVTAAQLLDGAITETLTASQNNLSLTRKVQGTGSVETDSARAGTVVVSVPIAGTRAVETNTAVTGTPWAIVTIEATRSHETDKANKGNPFARWGVLGQQALENDLAVPGSNNVAIADPAPSLATLERVSFVLADRSSLADVPRRSLVLLEHE